MREKKCSGCKITKPLNEFGSDISRRNGYTYCCKICSRRRGATPTLVECFICGSVFARRRDTASQMKAEGKGSFCPKCNGQLKPTEEHKQEVQLKSVLGKYKLSVKKFYEMLEKQNGVCKICGLKDARGRRLGVDHCHRTGKIRGLLCIHCNVAIGRFMDNPVFCMSAATYLTESRV